MNDFDQISGYYLYEVTKLYHTGIEKKNKVHSKSKKRIRMTKINTDK